MDEARWQEIERRRARNAYFWGLDRAAHEARYGGRRAEKKPRKKRGPKHTACIGPCGLPFRAKGVPVSEAPGTTLHSGKGYCLPCRHGRTGRPVPPAACIGPCKRPFRERGIPASQAPGTALHSGKGYCRACSPTTAKDGRKRAPRRARTAGPQRFQVPSHCVGCERPLRRQGQSAKDFPGSIRHEGGGLCRTCTAHKKAGGPPSREPNVRPCRDCGRNMRPQKKPASEFPDTVRHERNERCTACHKRHVRSDSEQG